jgi:DNA-binding transcriptional LysR family regulator
MIDFNQVVTFVEAVRWGSFSAAARSLEIPRSTVSARVRALEQSLDVRLLRRTTRRNALTDDGRAFYDNVASAVDAVRTAAAGVHGAHGALSGIVRLTAPPEYPLEIISAAVTAFQTLHPRVDVDVMLTNQATDFVDERVDLAIRGGPGGNAGLISIRLPDIAFGLYASPDYLAARGRPRRIADLGHHRLLWFKNQNRRRLLGLPRALQNQKQRDEPSVAADSMTLLKQLTMDGSGIAVLPRHLCRAEVARGRLAHLLPAFRGADIASVRLLLLSRRDIPARVRAFAEQLKAAATDPDLAKTRR